MQISISMFVVSMVDFTYSRSARTIESYMVWEI
jgi:hypothetical protein